MLRHHRFLDVTKQLAEVAKERQVSIAVDKPSSQPDSRVIAAERGVSLSAVGQWLKLSDVQTGTTRPLGAVERLGEVAVKELFTG